MVEIKIKNEGKIYTPVLTDKVTWTTERTGTAGKRRRRTSYIGEVLR